MDVLLTQERARKQLKPGTWRSCSGAGQMVCLGIDTHAVEPRMEGTWKSFNGRGNMGVPGMSGPALKLAKGVTSTYCNGPELMTARGISGRVAWQLDMDTWTFSSGVFTMDVPGHVRSVKILLFWVVILMSYDGFKIRQHERFSSTSWGMWGDIVLHVGSVGPCG